MYLRPIRKLRHGTLVEHWALVESYRTPRGPRQRVVSYLGDLAADVRAGVAAAAWPPDSTITSPAYLRLT